MEFKQEINVIWHADILDNIRQGYTTGHANSLASDILKRPKSRNPFKWVKNQLDIRNVFSKFSNTPQMERPMWLYDVHEREQVYNYLIEIWHETEQYKFINRLGLITNCEIVGPCYSVTGIINSRYQFNVDITMTNEDYLLYILLPKITNENINRCRIIK